MKTTFIFIIVLFSCIANAELPKKPENLSYAVGQMMMVGFHGKSVGENSPIVVAMKKYHIGGIIICDHRDPASGKKVANFSNPEELKKLINQLQFYAKKHHVYPLFISINQEGGKINALNISDPSQFELGKKSQQDIYAATFKRALLLKDLGVNVNLAPVADLNINPDNPAIGKLERSFGNIPKKVTEDLKTSIRAYKNANILCTLKHFPGLGGADKNTDHDTADLTYSWKESELIPYRGLIKSNHVCSFIMSSHLINKNLDKSGLPASFSKLIITDLLINEMGYTGLIITDDMDAIAIRKNFSTRDAIAKAVLAGNDIILYGGTQGYDPEQDTEMLFNTLLDLADNNPDVRKRVMQSYEKIVKTKNQLQ